MWKGMDEVSKSTGFIILIVLSSILGALEGSALCYIFSNFGKVWLILTLSFGLLLMGSLSWVYYYFKGAEYYTSRGIRPAFLTRPYQKQPSASKESKLEGMMLDALKASRYPLERRISVLKAIINGIRRDGKVTFEDVYRHLHSLDSSYQEDEVRDAFEFLSQPLLVIKQEKDGRYALALSKNELSERLWVLSQIFLRPPTQSILPAKPE
jgi:hypothetical protein